MQTEPVLPATTAERDLKIVITLLDSFVKMGGDTICFWGSFKGIAQIFWGV